MRKSVYSFLVIFTFIFVGVFSTFGQNKDILEEANQLYAAKQYGQAVSAYQKLLGEVPDAPTKAKIIFNLGMTYQQLKQYDKAIETFNRIFTMEVNDLEAGGNIMQAYRNYRPSAQWEIGNSLFAKGDYEGALAAYRATREKYPFRSWCGTCQQGFEYKYDLYEAVLLEHLGKYKDAVSGYLKISHPRLIEIYAANDQLADLKELIRVKDEPTIAERMRKYAWTREKAGEGLSTRVLSEYFRVYELGKEGNVSALMNLARQYAKNRNDSYIGDWIAKTLAKHPKLSVPFVSAELKNLQTYPHLFYRTLGFTGTPEAVAVLKAQAEKAISWYDAVAIVTALGLAGESGEAVLSELEQKSLSENMKLALQKYKNGELPAKLYEELKFPVSPKTKLPIAL